jgi:hypothetical protein
MSYTRMCLDLCGSLCVQTGRASSLSQMATKTLIGWFCIGKQHVLAYIPNYFIVSLHFFLQWYLFVTRTPYHHKSCDLEWWVACCEDFVVKSGVHAVSNQTCALLLAVFELRCSLHLGANLRNCQLRRPYSIRIS